MKSILCWLLVALVPCIAQSQTKINKSYPVNKGQTVEFRFDYPKTIKVSSWDKNEISVEASVRINGGENDTAFTLLQSSSDGKIYIENKLDMDKIPDTYYIMDKGIKTRFSSKSDMEAFIKEKGGPRPPTSQQKDLEITIEIKLPATINTEITSVYGMVEIQNFNGPIKVEARYGGIDASIDQKAIGKLKLTNRYGKIYSNLSLQPTEMTEQNFFTSLTASPGKGPSYDFSSSYGNIYLRNPQKQ
jgi:hypothetical protein